MPRRPTPTAIRIATGNPQHRPLPANEPKPGLACPDPPPQLAGEALAKWNELAPRLNRAGILTEVDGDALARWCVAHALYWQCQEIVTKEGPLHKTLKGNTVQHPALGIANRQTLILGKLDSALGLTPADRARVKVAPGHTESDDLNAFLAAAPAPAPMMN